MQEVEQNLKPQVKIIGGVLAVIVSFGILAGGYYGYKAAQDKGYMLPTAKAPC